MISVINCLYESTENPPKDIKIGIFRIFLFFLYTNKVIS